MRIILIYTPRSGSTSILNYFSKVKPEYECINEPWFWWMKENFHSKIYDYNEVILKDNIFIKTTYRTLSVPIENVMQDFDKVIFLLRKNIQEQIESSIFLHKNESFLSRDKQKYWIKDIDEEEITVTRERLEFLNNTLQEFSIRYNKPIFFYEDLYYNDFTPLFKELGIGYDGKYFNEYLDNKNRYRLKDVVTKHSSSLI